MRYKNSDYEIYEDGRCYSYKSHKFLTPQMTSKYPTYNLTLDGIKKKTKVHRMVAETFLPRVEGKDIVNHIDGNTHNFHLNNLEWVTASENSKHAIKTGLKPISSQSPQNWDIFENETWRDIKDYPNYMASNLGRIINKNTKKLLKLVPAKGIGYQEVNLWKEGKGKTYRVHRLIYQTFSEDYNLDGYVINHIDGNKINNCFTNLEKVTYQKNNLHAEYIIQTHKCSKKVAQMDLNYNEIAQYNSIREAEKTIGVSNISRAIKKNGRAGGYRWKFI